LHHCDAVVLQAIPASVPQTVVACAQGGKPSPRNAMTFARSSIALTTAIGSDVVGCRAMQAVGLFRPAQPVLMRFRPARCNRDGLQHGHSPTSTFVSG